MWPFLLIEEICELLNKFNLQVEICGTVIIKSGNFHFILAQIILGKLAQCSGFWKHESFFLQASFDSKLFALCLSFPVRYLAVNWSDTKILKHNPFNSSEMVKYELHEMLLETFHHKWISASLCTQLAARNLSFVQNRWRESINKNGINATKPNRKFDGKR